MNLKDLKTRAEKADKSSPSWPELKPGEVPIIAQSGERVLTPKENREKAGE